MKKTYKNRLLSLMVCTAMTASFIPAANVFATKNAILAPEGETLLFSEDFNFSEGGLGANMGSVYPRGKRPTDGYNDGMLSWWGGTNNGSWKSAAYADVNDSAYSAPNYSIALCAGTTSSSRSFEIYVPTSKRMEKGIVNVGMNLGFSSDANNTLTTCDIKLFENDSYLGGTAPTVMDIDAVNTLKGSDTSDDVVDTWYDFDCVIDLDNDTYSLTVSEHATGTEVYTKSGAYALSNFGGVVFNMGKSGSDEWQKCSPIMDNLLITHIAPDTAAEQEYDFTQNFEGSNSVVDRPEVLPAPPQFAGRYGHEVRTDDSTNGTKALYVSLGIKDGAAQLSTGDVKTSGKYKLTYSFYPSQQNNALVIDSRQIGGARARTDGGTWLSLPVDPFSTNRKWYDAEAIIDLDNDTATLTIYEEGTKTVVATVEKPYTDALGVFEFQQDGPNDASLANTVRIDNVYFYSIYENAPEFNETNFVCYAGDAAQLDKFNVSPMTDSVKVSFPQKMKNSTLTAENVYVTDENGNNVGASVDFNGGMEAVITFDEMLTPGATYEIHVANLRNMSGYLMDEEYVELFAVSYGEFDASLNNVTLGAEEVSGLSAFTAGANLTINYSAKNTTDEEQPVSLIVAYYNVTDDIPRLVDCQIFDVAIDAYSDSDSLTQGFTVPSKTFNKVSVMMWNSTDAMYPLSSVIDF